MQVTLRVAARLIRKLEVRRRDLLKKAIQNAQVEVSLFDAEKHIQGAIQEAEERLRSCVVELELVTKAKFQLRALVGTANFANGLGDIMNQLAENREHTIAYTKIFDSGGTIVPTHVLLERIKGLKSAEEIRYNHRQRVGVQSEEIPSILEALHQQEEFLRDALDSLNSKFSITIPDKLVKELADVGIKF